MTCGQLYLCCLRGCCWMNSHCKVIQMFTCYHWCWLGLINLSIASTSCAAQDSCIAHITLKEWKRPISGYTDCCWILDTSQTRKVHSNLFKFIPALICTLDLHNYRLQLITGFMMLTPTKSLAKPSNTTMLSATQAAHFTMSGIAALHTSTFAQGFSNNECQAAARALLRHDTHIDGTHYQTRKLGGLHPSYIGFNATAKQTHERALSHDALVEAVLQDVFDVVSHLVFCVAISHNYLANYTRPPGWWNFCPCSMCRFWSNCNYITWTAPYRCLHHTSWTSWIGWVDWWRCCSLGAGVCPGVCNTTPSAFQQTLSHWRHQTTTTMWAKQSGLLG